MKTKKQKKDEVIFKKTHRSNSEFFLDLCSTLLGCLAAATLCLGLLKAYYYYF